jgi:iron complex outermembrane receptor protein
MHSGIAKLMWIAIPMLFSSFLFAANGASALDEPASDGFSSEQAYLLDLPVILSASRLSQPLSESPNAMTVIDRQMIKATGFRSIADLFRLVPGMYVSNSNANMPIVSLNGVTDQYSRRMQVLIDGRSVYLPPFGGVAWQELPVLIDDIERIEVVRGPAAASYGSNSFYGVINIITRDGFTKNFKTISATKGEMGISEVSARLGKAGENFDYHFSFGYRSDDGNNPGRVNDSSTDRLLNLRSNYRADDSNSFELKLGLGDRSNGQGTAGRFQDAFRDVSVTNDFQQLDWLHTWNGKDESKLTLSRTSRHYKDPAICVANQTCIDTFGASGFGTEIANSQRQDIELQNTSQLGANNRAVWGAGLRTDYAYQPLIFKTPLTLHQSRIFVHDEWRVTESVLVNAGAMYEDDGAGHKNT